VAADYLGKAQTIGTRAAHADDITRSTAAGSKETTPAYTAGRTHAAVQKPTARVSHAPPSTPAVTRTASAPATFAPVTTDCTKPQFQTSDPSGGWSDGGYYVYNDMWNISGYSVTQTLYACAYDNWYVVANMNNASGDGAVKTYPNAHRDFNEPKISSFHSIYSRFAETSPHVGIYEDAYDIWINGVASSGSTEVMIWTENHHQVPGGSVEGTVTFDGRSYLVWKNGNYIAFEANTNFTSGTINLLEVFNWIMAKGWMPASSTLGQIDYGAEIVSTNGAPATFTFTNFSVSTS